MLFTTAPLWKLLPPQTATASLSRSQEGDTSSSRASCPLFRAEVSVQERGKEQDRRRSLTVAIDSPTVQGGKRVSHH